MAPGPAEEGTTAPGGRHRCSRRLLVESAELVIALPGADASANSRFAALGAWNIADDRVLALESLHGLLSQAGRCEKIAKAF